MTLEEAKKFYFEYRGFSFHMDREEPVKYSGFRMLNVGKDTLRQWDEELLENLFEELKTRPERVWSAHGDILKVIGRDNCDAVRYLSRLLDEMERMDRLEVFQVTLIIENMAGRTATLKDGGVYTFSRYPEIVPRMKAVMERLIAACAGSPDADDRFRKAVSTYRSAADMFCRG